MLLHNISESGAGTLVSVEQRGMRALRVLHVVPTFYPAVCYGGPIYSVMSLGKSLSSLNCEIKVLTTDANGPARRLSEAEKRGGEAAALNVHYCRRYGKGMFAPGVMWRVGAMVRWADVVHLTGVYDFTTFPVLAACRLYGKPLVWSSRGALQRWTGSTKTSLKEMWERVCRTMAPERMALHVTSIEEGQDSDGRLGNSELHVIPNGVDIPAAITSEPMGETLELLFVGRLDRKKGIENLFEACALLDRRSFFPWRLTVLGAGDTKYEASLKQLAGQLGIAGQVCFRGHLDGAAKQQAYADSNIVVVPSHTENFGLVVAEALAHARPVIASTATPWSEIEQRGAGYWIANTPESLYDGIRKMREADRTAMGAAGRRWMASEFSWAKRASECRSVYRQLINQ